MTDENNPLPVFEPVKPIGVCGLCQNELYPHSTCQHLARPDNCPLHGERWNELKMMHAARNIYIR